MNLRNILLLLLAVTFISCSNSSDRTSTSGQSTSNKIAADSNNNKKYQPSNIPADLDSKFEKFIEYFNKDSLFQVSRIDFPLKVRAFDEDKEIETVITKSDFRMLHFGDKSAKTREYDKYEETIKVNGNKAVIKTRGIDNGIFIDIYFEKKNGTWKLLTWVDSST